MFNGSSGAAYQDTLIENDGFWPDLNAGDFEKRRSIPTDMDSETVAYALAAAIAQINIALINKKTAYEAEGITSASDVLGQPKIGDKNLLVIMYEKAVFSRAKADLIPEFAMVQTKDAGDRVAENETLITERLLAESQQHVRAIFGKSRAGVELL
ncbi:head completion/stabilization protein [Aliivibrio sp. S4TY2]|uniref:head completion/stabilization protein n=1 Tax=unclassified Aliivibrio TaxID=2645654 RepID=UPI002379A1DB|nr:MULTISPECIES: head completion/stabilization protein [unclassified Aliivibrio]MDD9155450.1 head completion/stabilization protein [Aliivibrio sp. S4TY2]MDD9161577.1 head completion/stabilization protein [Aliivibrio sp. S4TY1]MDD9165607.1 head completion/stabilization protein [Aliivibrio sp. S4MY2]MDD9169606.1 head completion/stabilization protein [Aliivibrio sp. S4MY4]MDD9186599.1 head completion/stabilization protein [Aliivibrio sp. S4MY3]